MKYIIATNEAGMTVGLMFDAHFRHKDVAKYALEQGSVLRAGICNHQGWARDLRWRKQKPLAPQPIRNRMPQFWNGLLQH